MLGRDAALESGGGLSSCKEMGDINFAESGKVKGRGKRPTRQGPSACSRLACGLNLRGWPHQHNP